MKQKFSNAYMDIAERFAELSHARRLKVGCVIVKDDIIHPGYNGMPEGFDNNCEDIVWMDRGAGGWLDPEEIDMRWPFEGEQIDADGIKVSGRYKLVTKPEVLHAERNALDKMTRSGVSSKDAVLFVTHAPCLECAKSIYGAGISRLVYGQQYRDSTGTDFLVKVGVKVEQNPG